MRGYGGFAAVESSQILYQEKDSLMVFVVAVTRRNETREMLINIVQ